MEDAARPALVAPLLEGKQPKNRDQQGCCNLSKGKIIVISVSVTVILLLAAATTIFAFLPTISNIPKPKFNKTSLKHDVKNKVSSKPLENISLEAFAGHWKLDSQENLDDVLKAFGNNYVKRLIALTIRPELNITVHGPTEATMIVSWDLKSTTMKISFNQEFEDWTLDGRKVKTVHTLEGNMWVQLQRWNVSNNVTNNARIYREIIDHDLVETIYVNDVIGIRVYAKI